MSREFKDIDFLVSSLKIFDDKNSHILITGAIKSGKSTLLNEFIKKYYNDCSIDGIITKLVITDKFRIELSRFNCDKKVVIGERKVGGMDFFDDVFLENSFNIMNDFKKDTQILLFDEIGNNELHLKEYSDKLISYFQEYRIFAVLKKVGNPIFENLDKIGSYKLFDLDKMYE